MKFSSEPDIVFMKAGDLAVMIEIKGGKDPAGALERLGAIKKTFDESTIGCKNFLIVGVVTNKMGERLSETRLEKYFLYDELLDKTQYWEEFMNEIFPPCPENSINPSPTTGSGLSSTQQQCPLASGTGPTRVR